MLFVRGMNDRDDTNRRRGCEGLTHKAEVCGFITREGQDDAEDQVGAIDAQ